jgi:phosphoesterase RecJ-like protein
MNEYSGTTSLVQQLDPEQVHQAMAQIESAHRIALLAHEHPDGDCLGSALGFTHILRAMGKVCVPACADPAPPDFSFLPGLEMLQHTLGDEQFDLVIALDAGELSRYGTLYERHQAFLDRATILNIDHHISSGGCGQVNIIEPLAAATAELLVLFQQQAHLPLNRDAAQCLLTGLITDTASFQYPSTTPRTMEAGAVLLQAGAVAETIVQPLFRMRSLAQARFQAAVISQARTSCNGRLIWSYSNDETLAATGATRTTMDNSSSDLRDIEGVQVAAFFRNYSDVPELTRLSLRSMAPFDCAAFCMRLGGGGHPRAAGAGISLPLQEALALVVAQLENELSKM